MRDDQRNSAIVSRNCQRPAAALAGPAQDPARQARPSDRDDLGSSQYQPDGAGRSPASTGQPANRTNMRYQWIAGFTDNHLVDCDEVMEPFVREVLAQTSAMTSHGSSPCPTNPAPSQRSTRPRAGASSRCSPASNRAAWVKTKPTARARALGQVAAGDEPAALFRGFHRPERQQHQSHRRRKKDRDISRET